MASTRIYRTSGTPTNRKKFTISCWLKKSKLSDDMQIVNFYEDASNRTQFSFNSSDQFDFIVKSGNTNTMRLKTTRLFRDPSAWYHIVMTVDTTQSTNTDRLKLYVNEEQQTSFATETYPSQNADATVGGTHNIGAYDNGGSPTLYWDGLLTHLHYTDGYAYTASDFGETDSTSGIWKPKTSPSGINYGTNGFFLKFENSGNLDLDSSGNNLSFATSGNLTQNVDTPSNNFATINTLNIVATGLTVSNGNLSITGNTGDAWRSLPATFGVSSGKYYYECKIKSFNTGLHLGIIDYSQVPNSNAYAYQYSRAYMYKDDGNKANNNSSTSYGNSFTTNDIIGVALDLDNGKIYFSKNGTYQNSGDPTSGATGTGSAFDITSGYDYTPVFSTNNTADQIEYNFGQGYFGTTAVASAGTAPSEGGIFEFDCPNGYQALCTKGINSF
nr:spry domain protein [uncultured Mediterranean phage uvMED]